jgi:4-amino-4-deoxy-L-arabinose transferase-like glycosyltransferase
MEARRLLILLAAVVLIRLPFLDHPIQGDDVYYLAIARNVPIDPLHPMQMGYTFQGDRVSMAGHPHPPLNAYILALLIQIFGDIREVPFHAAYLVFSLAAVAAMYRLSRRFTDRPLLAATLFLSVPAFLVNGNSLESDLPFLAFWMAGFAFYFDGRHRLAAASLALAAMSAYQAVFAVPILAHHAWYHRRRSKTAWLAVVAAPLTIGAWQAFQIASTGQLPASVLSGY